VADSTHTNGNGYKWKWKATQESFGLGIAEGVSMAVSLGVVAVADQIAPNLLQTVSKTLSRVCVEPYLENIEWGLGKICKLDECKPNLEQSRDERAEALAKTMIVFGAAWSTSMVAKMGTRLGMNRLLQIKPKIVTGNWFRDNMLPQAHDWKVLAWDEGIHIGSLIMVNTGAAKVTDEAIKVTDKLLQNCGWSEHKAKEIASMAMIWEVPNFLGWLAGVGSIFYDHYKENAKQVVQAAIGTGGHGHIPGV
jgi:hypothetical protein